MRCGEAGLELIRAAEGLKLKPYRDPIGVWTVGYGHTRGVTADSPPITEETAERLLLRDVEEAEEIIARWVREPLNQNQHDALASFVFNVGPGKPGVKSGFVYLKSGATSTMLRLLNQRRFIESAQEFDKWVYGAGKVLDGLKARRAREKELFLRPVLVK